MDDAALCFTYTSHNHPSHYPTAFLGINARVQSQPKVRSVNAGCCRGLCAV